MNGFVIISGEGFYTGNSYVYQGERVAVFDKNIHRAKRYSTFKRADNAREKMQGILFFEKTEVKEVKDGKLL